MTDHFHEVIVRLVGLESEPEGPAVVGIIIRLPGTGDSLADVQAAVDLAQRTTPNLSLKADLFKMEVMLGGRWHADMGDE